MSTCISCRHWKPVALATSDDGECSRVGVSFYTKSRHVVLDGNIIPYGKGKPTLIVPAQFGCIRWEAR